MQANVDEVGGDLERRKLPGKIEDAKGTVVPAQKIIDVRAVPSPITQLEDGAAVRRQGLEKVRQTRRIRAPVRRQLEQERPQLVR